MTMNNNFLNNLLNSISVSGYEEQVQDIVEEEMKDYVDEVRRDEMQNVTCVINPNSDIRIMLSAHADEIGLLSRGLQRKAEFRRLSVEVSFIRIIRDRKFGFIRKRGLCMVL